MTSSSPSKSEPRRVTLIGVGGVGTFLAEGLVRILEFSYPGSVFNLVDGDHFEPKNAERQIFTEIGNKADTMARKLGPYFPRTFIIPFPQWVVEDAPEGAEDMIAARDLLAEGDLVLCVTDNFAARKIVFDAAKDLQNIDVFTGGNDDKYFGSTYHYRRVDGKDVTDHPVLWHDEFINPPDRNPALLSCQERAEIEGGTQLIVTNMAVATILLAQTHHLLGGTEKRTDEVFFDLGEMLMATHDRQVEPVAQTETNEKVSVVNG